MTDLQLYQSFSSLPPNLKKELEDFVAFLQSKAKKEKPIKQRQFGYAKGFFKMQPDFDEPLEDFKDYQP
jgi:hypothetical protein